MKVSFSSKGAFHPPQVCTVSLGSTGLGMLKYNEYDLKAVKFPVVAVVVAVKCEYPVQTVHLSKANETAPNSWFLYWRASYANQ